MGAVLVDAADPSATLAGRPLHAWARDALAEVYAPSALDVLRAAPESGVEELDPVKVALPPAMLRTVATPEELEEAATRLR
jgi:hypothetical protein